MTLTLKREFFSVFLCYKVIFWLNEMLYHTLLSFQTLNIICLLLKSSVASKYQYHTQCPKCIIFFKTAKVSNFANHEGAMSSILFTFFPTEIHILVLSNFKDLLCNFPFLVFIIKIVNIFFVSFFGNGGIFWFYMVSRKH